jgi:bacteriocin biosynthesis cyclodehydratase domain-containing protein
MTSMTETAAHGISVVPPSRAVDTVRGRLTAHCADGVALDVGILGMPPTAAPAAPRTAGLRYTVRIAPGALLLGPLYRAGGAGRPCARCLDRRWLALRPVEERRALEDGADATAIGDDPALGPFLLDQAARVVAAETSGRPPGTGEPAVADVVELDTCDLTLTRHRLLADSECELCAAPREDTPDDAGMPLARRPKATPTSYRGASALALELPTDAYVNPVCGALAAQTRKVYKCSATLPVSGYFRVRSKYDYHEMWWSGQSQSSASSERHGILEGLERYAGQFPRARRRSVEGSYAELAEHALDPRLMGSYGEDFYARHTETYRPFDPAATMPWVWGWSHGEQRPVLVPEQLVFYLDRTPDRKFVQECSNGCASGTSTEEALLHGMLELLERDAFLLNWYAGARLPEIDAADCADEEIHFMLDRVDRLGYRMRLFDMRVDMPVPVVMSVAERLDGGLGRLCFAAGAGLDPLEAMRAAIAETASYIPGMDERVQARLSELKPMTEDYSRLHELTQHALLYGLPEMASVADFLLADPDPRPMAELYGDWLAERPSTLDMADDVRHLTAWLRDRGSDVIAVDQTCPEQGGTAIRTLCVIAPGLVPIDFGWERQRALSHPRLHAYLAGELPTVHPAGRGYGPTGINPRPHPFP